MNTKAKFSTLLCGAVATALFTSVSSGISIATWELSGEPGNQTTTAGSGSPNVSAAALARGAGLGTASGADSFNSNGWGGTDADDYLSFGFSIAPGYSVKLASILLGTRSSDTAGTLGLYSSIDNFVSPVQQWQQTGNADYANWNFSISALGLVSGDVEFRILEIGDTRAGGSDPTGSTTNGGTFRIADYTPTGSTASPVTVTGEIFRDKVPEGGSSIALLGLALCAVGATRKFISSR